GARPRARCARAGAAAGRPGRALTPVPTHHQPADAIALERVEFDHQLGIERHAGVVEQRDPTFLAGLFVQYAHRMRSLFWPIVCDIEGGEDVAHTLQPLPSDQCSCSQRGEPHLDRLGAESLELGIARGWRLAVGALEPHLRERIAQRYLARVAARGDVPGPPARFHRMVDGSAALALDHVTGSVRFLGYEQPVVEGVDHVAGDGCEADLTQSPAIAQEKAADQAEATFMGALSAVIQLGKATVAAVLTEDPVERAKGSTHSRADVAAAAPSVESRQQHRLRPLYGCSIIAPERLVADRTPRCAGPRRHVKIIVPAVLARLTQGVARQRQRGALGPHLIR